MKLTILQYYILIVLGFTIAMCIQDIEIGIHYFLFLTINAIALYFSRKSHRVIITVFLGSMFLSYFVRGYVVALDHNMFTFNNIFAVDRARVIWSFDAALKTSLFVSIGMIIGSFKASRLKTFSRVNSKHKDLVSNFWVIILILTILLFLKIGLVQFAGVGLKGMENQTSLAFLLRFIPLDLPFIVISLAFFKYWMRYNFYEKSILIALLIGFAYSVFITGSKSFVMIIALCYGIYLMYSGAKIYILKFLTLIAIAVALTGISFALSKAVKMTYFLPDISTQEALQLGFKLMVEEDALAVLNEISARFNGFDGQLKYQGMLEPKEQSNLHKLRASFTPKSISLNIIEGLVPKVELTSQPFCGNAVGVYVEKFPKTKPYAGAVGLSAVSYIVQPNPFIRAVLLMVMGYFLAVCVSIISLFKHADVRFILLFSFAFFVMNLAMSGNIDFLVIDLLYKIILLVVFLIIVVETRKLSQLHKNYFSPI